MPRRPSLLESLLPVLSALLIIGLGVGFYREQVAVPVLLALSCVPPALLAWRLGLSWKEIEGGLLDGMRLALGATVILLVVGTTIGSWALSGTIATLVHYGLGVLRPAWFLPATAVITSVVSLAIGSSWTTAATVGVALMGIGGALGVPAPMTAGAVLSGAYFGDKMSPLSDTTNLAPGVAGSELFEHIHAMLYTTLPAWLLAVLLYALLGLAASRGGSFDPSQVEALRAELARAQVIHPALLAPPLLVIALALLRVPAVPALLLATAAAELLAALVQGSGVGELLSVLYDGYQGQSGSAAVDALLDRGGMASMLDTIAIVLWATGFGGLLERAGFVEVLLEALLRRVRTPAGLITSTVLSSIGVNFLLAEQYLSIVLPGRMFRETYPRFGLQRRMLSRTLEDGGTVTSALCPWNSGGAFMARTLGVPTTAYAPYAFLNLLVPLIAIFYAWTGLFLLREESPPGA